MPDTQVIPDGDKFTVRTEDLTTVFCSLAPASAAAAIGLLHDEILHLRVDRFRIVFLSSCRFRHRIAG